jgi:hypothetical protein
LIETTHIDPENQLLYKTVGIKNHGRLLAADSRLAASPNSPAEAIHALDIAKITYHHITNHTNELKRVENEEEYNKASNASVNKGLHRTFKSAHQTKSSKHRTSDNTSLHQTRNSQHRTINNTSAHQTRNHQHHLNHKSSSRDETRKRKSERIANMKILLLII